MFSAKILRKAGGQIRRTISSLPRSVSLGDIITEAAAYSFGYRIDHDQIVIFA